MGISRDEAPEALKALVELQMGVRLDRPGVLDWDYHTAGAGVGIRKAEGGIKLTASTGEPETLLSRRQYLWDASFLVALRGDSTTINLVEAALRNPVWPVFLGRKCCVPSEPLLAAFNDDSNPGGHASLKAALETAPFFTHQYFEAGSAEELDAFIEHTPGSTPPDDARLVYDVPRTLQHPSHGPRWVFPTRLLAPRVAIPAMTRPRQNRARLDYASDQWKAIRKQRLQVDNELCVFCKSPAEEVHHVTYENVGHEQVEDLRSLCRMCHDACTQLEYGHDMREHRIDPTDPKQRGKIMRQINLLVTSRRLGRRRAILENTRAAAPDFLSDAPG